MNNFTKSVVTDQKPPASRHYDVVILGGGAAGLMCALTAGGRGRRVLVVEVSNKLGKKILMSGGGRCNFTNLDIEADNFICENPHFVKSALSQYSQWDFIALVAKYQIAYHEKSHGQLFCDVSSKEILAMLKRECEKVGVEVLINCRCDEIFNFEDVEADIVLNTPQLPKQGFVVKGSVGDIICNSLVVASGGLSIPSLGGATGYGYKFAEKIGLKLNLREPSLVPFTLSGKWHELAKTLAGVSVEVVVSVADKQFAESLLFTHRGLSGPAILQISNYWHLGSEIEIDLLPGIDVAKQLTDLKTSQPNKTVSSCLQPLLPKSLVQELRKIWWGDVDDKEKTLQEQSNKELLLIGGRINHWCVVPSGTEGYRTAEVTRGGVDVNSISSKTMQVKSVEGLYFIGEVLDVTGHLGGFNFQWAWASGHCAGQYV